jgi:hypothetical protein
MRMKHWMQALVFAVGSPLALAQVGAPDAVGLRGDVGGLWYTPSADGQGLQIDVLDGGRAAVTWYTFATDGRPLWLFGLGRVDGGAIEAEMASAAGGGFLLRSTQPRPSTTPRGRLRVSFAGCNSAELLFADNGSGLPSGSVALQRLSAPQGTRCSGEEDFAEQRIISFERGPLAFQPLFADLPVEGQDIYELDFAYEALPAPLQHRRGLRLTGMNRSDDLAMLIKGPVDGLLPNRLYQVELEVEYATPVPSGCAGVGGSPGESVYVKLGAVDVEPRALETNEGGTRFLRLNFDFGNQSQSGESALVVGDMANSQECSNPDGTWELKTGSTEGTPFRARTDGTGRLWVVAGTDSAFEGLTHVYYTSLRVRLQPVATGS